MKSRQGHRRLGIERCEQRRVLSANPFNTDGLSFNFSQDSSYLQAASSGLTPVDTDSGLVTITTLELSDKTTAGLRAMHEGQPVTISNGGGITSSDLSQGMEFDLAGVLFSGTTNVVVSGRSWSDFSPTVTEDLSSDTLNDSVDDTIVPFDPVGDGDDSSVDPRPTDTASTPIVIADKQAEEPTVESNDEINQAADDLPPRREPQSGVGAIERVVTSRLPAGIERPGAGLIDLAQLLEPASDQMLLLASGDSVVVPTPNASARDAALAVESWVRSVPTTSPAQIGSIEPGAVPNETLRAEESEASDPEATSEPARPNRQPTTAQTNQSAEPAQSPRAVSSEVAGVRHEAEVAAPGVMGRSSAYRLAVAAFSTLLGGGLVWVAKRQSPGADCLEHPRRRDPRSMNNCGR